MVTTPQSTIARHISKTCILSSKAKSLLSIGAGSGALEIELALKHNLSLGYVDPNLSEAVHFITEVNKNSIQLVDYFNGTFEGFQTQNKYDLIVRSGPD